MASETTFDHWKVVFSWGKMRKKGPNSKPPHLLILIVWILSLHIIICQLQIKSTVIHSFCSLHVPDKCASIFKMLMLLGSSARRRMSSLNIWCDNTIISSCMKKPQCEKVLPSPESCCGCPRFDWVSRQLQNFGLVGRTARAVWLQRVQVLGKKLVSTKALFSNSMSFHPF